MNTFIAYWFNITLTALKLTSEFEIELNIPELSCSFGVNIYQLNFNCTVRKYKFNYLTENECYLLINI